MQISLTEEDKKELELVKQEFRTFIKESLSRLINTLEVLLNFLLRYLSTYREYSIKNIKQKGFINILQERALRFFGIEEEPNKRTKRFTTAKKKTYLIKVIRKTIKVILLPVYLLIVVLSTLLRKKLEKKCKNCYKT